MPTSNKKSLADSNNGAQKKGEKGSPTPSSGGEDESSTERDGDDSHLHEDQKSRKLET